MSIVGRKILLSCGVRTFAYGYVAVILALYLDRLGLSPVQVGLVLTAAMLGSAVMNALWSLVADRYGRRRTVTTMALLMAGAGLVFATTDRFAVFVLAGLTGTISATSADIGVFQSVEQAILPQTTPNERRTWLFAVYNMVGFFGGALGSLFAGVAAILPSFGFDPTDAYRTLFILYAVIGCAEAVLWLTFDDTVESHGPPLSGSTWGLTRSRRSVTALSALFAIDSFAGGLAAPPLIALWFVLRWGLSLGDLAVAFFLAWLLSGASLIPASWLAHRLGLLNALVVTHVPANLLLMLIPLAPTAPIAVGVFLARMSLSQMDVPIRQSYTMALVDPTERTATAGITNLARTVASAISPSLTGIAFGGSALALPFLAAGALKLAYDGLILRTFRNVPDPR